MGANCFSSLARFCQGITAQDGIPSSSSSLPSHHRSFACESSQRAWRSFPSLPQAMAEILLPSPSERCLAEKRTLLPKAPDPVPIENFRQTAYSG